MPVKTFRDNLSLVLAGEAGQGIQSIEAILTVLIKKGGYNIFACKEYMSRVRGGVNSIEIRISSERRPAFVNRIDMLIPLNPESIPHLSKRLSKETIIIGEKDKIGADNMLDIPFTRFAAEIGNPIYSNTIAAGFILGLLKIDLHLCEKYIITYFQKKSEEVQNQNLTALLKGYELGMSESESIIIEIRRNPDALREMMVTGAEAVAMGALAGGCNYTCAYPMSPSTVVLEKMAAYSKQFDILVEQVEDEIGVVNMALGAWYAGARALVTTSGGGFALMTEGISLAGMIESPLVLHLAQRPGPATGLPTRTEQGDLMLAVFAGHGEFPRIILSPGTLEEAFYLTQKAFYLADKYQIPVFILTDQYFVDSYYNTPVFNPDQFPPESFITPTDESYQRHAITENGISPRGIPGFGKGMVCSDSDEHDTSGHITESEAVRNSMVEKRLRKAEAVKSAATYPEWDGSMAAKTLIIGWGSTKNIISEALSELNLSNTAQLHFSWIWPFPSGLKELLSKAENIILIENNETGQLGKLIRMETGIEIKKHLLKYSGMPFSVEELVSGIRKYI